jgi:hypothetical protein
MSLATTPCHGLLASQLRRVQFGARAARVGQSEIGVCFKPSGGSRQLFAFTSQGHGPPPPAPIAIASGAWLDGVTTAADCVIDYYAYINKYSTGGYTYIGYGIGGPAYCFFYPANPAAHFNLK